MIEDLRTLAISVREHAPFTLRALVRAVRKNVTTRQLLGKLPVPQWGVRLGHMRQWRAMHEVRARLLWGSGLLIGAVSAVACGGEVGANQGTGPVAEQPLGPGGEMITGSAGAPGMMEPGMVVGGAGQAPEQPWVPPVGEVFEGPIVAEPSASSRFPRLTHEQWDRTVRDLFGLEASWQLSNTFVSEPLLSTFNTNGSVLAVSQDLWLDYQRAAESVGALVAANPAWLEGLLAGAPSDAEGRATAFVERLGTRAYRRPLAPAETQALLGLFHQGTALIGGDAFAAGVELVTSYVLQSPHFLYRAELSTEATNGKIRLNGYEVANRLAYGLTGSMPDAELFEAAAAGALSTREQVTAQASRLLQSAAASEVVADFHRQFLRMQEYEGLSKNDPLFDGDVGADVTTEALRFSEDVVLDQAGTFAQLLSAPYTFGNGRIRQIYGEDALTAVDAAEEEFVRIELDPSRRAGLLTQIGFLAANGEGRTPNSIMRGVHISHRVVCSELPPPPDMIPPLPELSPDQTNRQRVEALTGAVACSACHGVFINPLGFSLENFDGFGQYRNMDNGQPVDASGTYILDGAEVTFQNAAELMQRIAESQQANDCYARRWTEYVTGRDVDKAVLSDANLISQAGALSRGGASVTEVITQLVGSDAFLTRLP